MPLLTFLLHENQVGPDELLIVLGLVVAALFALYHAVRMPRLPEYQRKRSKPEVTKETL